MMGNIGPLARFDENIGNIQNIFYMMGKQAKNDVVLYLWEARKQMARH